MNDERGKVWIALRRSFNSSLIIHHLSFLLCYAVDRLPPGRYDEEEAGGNRRKLRRADLDRKVMNPIWTNFIYNAASRGMRICTHCRKAAEYALKRPGQFYKCKHCGHRFQEKKK